ncbi:hypothetical protein DFQ26_008173 [Actinomortierella ambigua]|nr:hypothetical protein DFQ26_008173 [Actinomortierella ambigua]
MRAPISHVVLLLETLRRALFRRYIPVPELGLPEMVPDNPAFRNLSPTPPMGFNNWARYECHLNQTLFTETADFMLEKGFLKAGYNTITVDDCWMTMQRHPVTKDLVVNADLFPQGMAYLGKYLHDRGFQFGIYQDVGDKTCGGYPGSLGHYQQDIALFTSWGVDFIKLDGCYVTRNASLPPSETLEPTFRQLYESFGLALRQQSRPVVYSESAPAYFSGLSAGTGDRVGKDWYKVHTWIGRYGQLWRHSTDIAVWRRDEGSRWESVMTNYRFNIRLARYQAPGNWNDPDFIIVGDDEGLTWEEQKSQFALWAIMASPLILSSKLKDLNNEQIALLTNPEIIAVNQDSWGTQARLIWRSATSDTLLKPLNDTRSFALAILNKESDSLGVYVPFSMLGYDHLEIKDGCQFLVREIITRSEQVVDVTFPRFAMVGGPLPPHGTALYRIRPLTDNPACYARAGPSGALYLASSLMCADVSQSRYAVGTEVIAYPCSSSYNQQWRLLPVPPPSPQQAPPTDASFYVIKTLTDSYCFDVVDARPNNGSRVVLNTCNTNSLTQQWRYTPKEGTLTHIETGLCLDASDVEDRSIPLKEKLVLQLRECGDFKNSQVWSLPI